MDKHQIARILNHIGMLLELKGESFFKSKAYYDGARAVELLEEDIGLLVQEKRLKDIKGFGEALTAKVTELVTTGGLKYYEELQKEVPSGLIQMLKIPGMGAKKVKAVYDSLGISSVQDLRQACLMGKLASLTGFGVKTQSKVLEGIENLGRYSGQFLFPVAMEQAAEIIVALIRSGLVIRISEGGSLRRRKEIVKDIDILASSSDSVAVMDFFTKLPFIAEVMSRGDTKTSVTLTSGINADLRVVTDIQYPYALHHFTGSKEHNTALRHIAKQENIKVNEYGLFKGDGEELIKCESEEDIFKVFEMDFIPPELRENNGELEAAKEGRLPELIEQSNIRGVIHIHTVYSDGTDRIEDIVKTCIAKGYSYMGVSDHSLSAHYAGGMKADAIFKQHEEIDRLRLKYTDFKIFKGIELDILADGNIDYDESILELFDFTIASVHSQFNMDEDKLTQRVIKAMKNRYVTILGHPTGRLLLSRDPFRINIEEIIKTAAEEGVMLEINTNPHRLDLDWRYCKKAKEAGCSFVLSPDAHAINELDDIQYGINVARKGWLTAADIINTKSASEISKLFGKRMRNSGVEKK